MKACVSDSNPAAWDPYTVFRIPQLGFSWGTCPSEYPGEMVSPPRPAGLCSYFKAHYHPHLFPATWLILWDTQPRPSRVPAWIHRTKVSLHLITCKVGGDLVPIIYSNNKPLPQAYSYSPDLIRYFVNRGRGRWEKTIVVIMKMISICFRCRSNHHFSLHNQEL